jgi:hypothetical protein
LRGIGGFALALPALEIMAPQKASADALVIPKRFVISYGGVSTAADGHDVDLLRPATIGTGYELTRALKYLGATEDGDSVQNDVSVVTDLMIPWSEGALPPAGKSVYFHYNTVGPHIAGTSTSEDRGGEPRGPTCDQVVASAIGGDTLHQVLTYRVQVGTYINYNGSDNSTSGTSMTLSWKEEDGGLVAVEPTFSPELAWGSLFGTFTPSDPEGAELARRLLRRRISALDLVHASTERLLPKLGAADRQRLERHFDEIRALEKRLATAPPIGGSCQVPTQPTDPPIGHSSSIYTGNGCEAIFDVTGGWSDEDKRADLLTDFICMAFACDLSRVASLMITEWKSYINAYPVTGKSMDMHSLTHNSDNEGVADMVGWHIRQFARLVRKLRNTPEIDGSSLLDHSSIVLVFEGGHGYDPEGGGDLSSHSTENMCALIGGRAGGLKTGQHLSAPGMHPANVVISAMDAVGVTGGLGELTEGLPGLFV